MKERPSPQPSVRPDFFDDIKDIPSNEVWAQLTKKIGDMPDEAYKETELKIETLNSNIVDDFTSIVNTDQFKTLKQKLPEWKEEALYAFYRANTPREWGHIVGALKWATDVGQAMIEFKMFPQLLEKAPSTRNVLIQIIHDAYPNHSEKEIKGHIDTVMSKGRVQPKVV